MQAIDEENHVEEDLFSEVRIDEKISKKDLAKRIKEIENDSEFFDELEILTKYQNLTEEEKKLKREIKTSEEKLDEDVHKRYADLKESEIKKLVIQDKWLDSLNRFIDAELEQISYNLAGRIDELAERYDVSLSDLTNDVQVLAKNVDEHLKQMGFKW